VEALIEIEQELKDLKLRVSRLEEENNRLRVITQEAQTSLAHLRTLVDHFAQTTLNLHGTEEGKKEEVQRLKKLVDGDPGLGISGLRQDMKEAREQIVSLIIEKDALINQAKGAWWLAGIAGLTTLANIVAFLRG
jgi:hypothetical protein